MRERGLMIHGNISVISIPVRDQEASKAFYMDKLNFELVSDMSLGGGTRWITLRPVGSGAAIALVTWFKEMKPGSLRGLVLSVESIEAAIEELEASGVRLGLDEIQKAPWGRWISIDDPDGNSWIIQQDLLMETKPES